MSHLTFSKNLQAVKPSATLTITAQAEALKAQGYSILSLSAGEPDFKTPELICEAAIKAIHEGKTRYTAVTGTPELKKAIQEKFLKENALSYESDEIIVGCGAKQLIFNAFLATLNAQDEVLIPAPYWVSYPEMVTLCGAQPKTIEGLEEGNFKLKPEQLEAALTLETKWFILNSPSNPTGAVYDLEELKGFAEVLRKFPKVHILSDDIYEHILYTTHPYYTLAQVAPDLKERILTINGVSKAYAMTGWRIGYAGGPKKLIEAMGTIQSQSTSNPCSISQAAAVAALKGPQDHLLKFREVFRKRRDRMVDLLNQVPGIYCPLPEGAFYLYPSCKGLLNKKTPDGDLLASDVDITSYFLKEAGVATVPGAAFGLSPYFRISYATSLEILEEAVERIKGACLKLEE